MTAQQPTAKVPRYFVALIIALALPLLSVPAMLTVIEQGYEIKKYFIYFYPLYILVASYLAYQCYRLGRKVMAWILLVLMLLTDISIWTLAFM